MYAALWIIVNSTEQSPFWETDSHSTSQEISQLLLNLTVYYYVYKSPPWVSVLN